MRLRRGSRPRLIASWLVALALALSGAMPGHGGAVAAAAAGPGQDGLIVICGAGGPLLIDPATGEPAGKQPERGPAAAARCALCCGLAATGTLPAPQQTFERLVWTPAPAAMPRDRAALPQNQRPWSPATPRAPPRPSLP